MSALPDPASALAHGAEARFVHQVLALGEHDIVCRGRIPQDCPALTRGVAPTWVAIELAAQAAGLLPAAREEPSTVPRVGYLVRVRDARWTRPTVPAEADLIARVERVGGAGPLALFRARIELDGAQIASASLGTYLAPSSAGAPRPSGHSWRKTNH